MKRALFVAVTLAWSAAASAQVIQAEEMVAMRDGTRLATTVWRVDDTPRPVLLRRTPYGRAIAADAVAGVLGQGYVLVSQDVRGRGGSEGTFIPFQGDADDGFDAIGWIAEQPWSNDRVGTYGGSAEGITQLMATGAAPAALECAIPMVATADMHEAIYPGGAWRTELGTAWLNGLMEPEALAQLRMHEARDAYWDAMRWDATEIARVDIPIFMIGGTFDIFAIGTPATFHAARTGSMRQGDQFLLFGPWVHGAGQRMNGELLFPEGALYAAYIAELLAFFDWCLKDGPRPTWAPVRYWVTELAGSGTEPLGEWRDAQDWPPPSTAITFAVNADGTLAPGTTADAAPVELPSDPINPIPSLGGGNLTTAAGPYDQGAIDARDDVFIAETAPVGQLVEVIGDVRASIFASSATDDVDVIVRLMQVTPSGQSILLTDGIRRGRFVRSLAQAEPLTPGMPARFDLDVGPVSIALAPGHSLRIAIQATSSPRYEPNPGTSAPIATAVPQATTLRLHFSSTEPSTIVLPIARGAEEFGVAPDRDAGMSGGSDAGMMPEMPSSSSCACRAGRSEDAPLALLVPLLALLFVRRR
jgi:predicted acyl esterase